MSVNVGSAIAYLDLDISKFEKGISSAISELNTLTDSSSSFSQKISSIGSAISTTGSTLTKTFTVPVAGLGTAATKLAADFESAMSKVEAISGSTSEEMSQLTDKAIEMGAKTKFSAKESADAFTYMAMAGWDAEQMMSGISGIMSLAAADGLDLATTSDIVTDALTAFGLQASDSAEFADALAMASSAANTNVSMLGESFKYVAPVAGSLGYDYRDIAVALGLMANSGIKASQAGTTLRAALTRMAKPTKDMKGLMEEYNLSITNSDGSMKSYAGVMEMLRTKLGGLSEAEQAKTAAILFGQEAMSGMLAIINASEQDYKKLTDAIYESKGAAEEMASVMMDNLSGSIEQFLGALESLAIKVGTAMIPVIRQITEFVTSLVEKLNTLSDEQIQMIVIIASVVAAIGPLLIIIGKVVSAVATIGSAIGSVISIAGKVISFGGTIIAGLGKVASIITGVVIPAISSIGAPILVIVGIVGALVAACVAVYKNWEELSSFASEAWNSIMDAVGSAAKSIGEFFSNMVEDIRTFITNLGETVSTSFNTFIENTKQFLSGMISSVTEGLSNILKSVADWGSGLIEKGKEIAKNFVEGFTEFFKNLSERVMGFISGLIEKVSAWGRDLVDIASRTASGFVESMTSGIDVVVSTFMSLFENLINAVTSFKDMMFEAGKDLFTSMFEGIKSVWEGIKSWLSDAMSTVSSMVSKITEPIKTVYNKVTSFFNGSHANGLDYVPFDGYVAQLHKGERVLTKEESKEYDSGRNTSGGDTYNFYNTKPDPYEYARQMKRAKKEMEDL